MAFRIFKRPSRQDILLNLLDDYAERFRVCAEIAPLRQSERFWNMARLAEAIGEHVSEDPQDMARLRAFITHHLSHIVQISEASAKLMSKSTDVEGLEAILSQIDSYHDLLQLAEKACLENDIRDIQLTMDALDQQLARLRL